MENYDLIIIGAGISGMTAALGAYKSGIKNILIIEREKNVGGIVNQFIHNGFGEKLIGHNVTGPEYIDFLQNELKGKRIDILLGTTVLDVTSNKVITYVNSKDGVNEIAGKAIIFAMGAREKYCANIDIPINGFTGIFTVGEAQRIVNIEGYLPGKKVIIVANDKWGFILARRLFIEGANIEGIIMDTDLDCISKDVRKIVDGFNIPVIENSKILDISGDIRINNTKVINVETKEIADKACDCLILSVSFVPENDKIKKLRIEIDKRTMGPKVNDYSTSVDGFFACGNIIYGQLALNMGEFDGTECGETVAQYMKKYIL